MDNTSDEIEEVKKSLDKQEEDVDRQEDAVKKIKGSKDDDTC